MATVTRPDGSELGKVTDPALLRYYRRAGYQVDDDAPVASEPSPAPGEADHQDEPGETETVVPPVSS